MHRYLISPRGFVAGGILTLAGVLFLAYFLASFGSEVELELTTEDIAPESGFAYIVQPDFLRKNLPFGFSIHSDSNSDQTASTLILRENGHALGPAHSLHTDIRNRGEGAFSHWEDSIRFSTSDNTDPERNGRRYSIVFQYEPSATGLVIAALSTAALPTLLLLAVARSAASRYGPRARAAASFLRRHDRVLAITLCVAIVFAWLTAIGRPDIRIVTSADSMVPAAILAGEIIAVQGSLMAAALDGLSFLAPHVFHGLARLTGIGLVEAHIAGWAISVVCAAGVLGMVAARLAGSIWAAPLLLIALPFSRVHEASIGYPLLAFEPRLQTGAMGQSLALCIWGAWLVYARSPRRHYAACLLAGGLFNLHPGYGLGLIAILALGALLERLPAVRPAVMTAAVGLGISLLGATPLLVSMLTPDGGPNATFDETDWWALMAFRKPFHVFIWDHAAFSRLVVLLALLMSLGLMAYRQFPKGVPDRLLATVAIGAIAAATGFVSVEILPWPRLAGAVPSRVLFLVTTAAVLMICTLAFRQRTSMAGAMLLSALALSHFISLGNAQVVALIMLVVVPAVLMHVEHGSRHRLADRMTSVLQRWNLVAASVTAAAVVALLCSAIAEAQRRIDARMDRYPDSWNAVMDWMRTSTPKEALFLMPPYPYAVYLSRRSNLVDYYYIGVSVYVFNLVPRELALLRKLYDVELHGQSPEQVAQHIAAEGGILCLLEKGYRRLISTEDRLRTTKKHFPRLDFALGFKPGTLPPEWTCGPHLHAVLDLPIAFQNDKYVVYDLRTIPTAP